MHYNAKFTLYCIVLHDMIPMEVTDMPDYKRMYLLLFNAITDALSMVERGKLAAAIETLRRAQRETEEMYIETPEQPS